MFTLAYLWLAREKDELKNTKARDEALKKAATFKEEATDKDRLWIESSYAYYIENDPQKQSNILEIMADKYPKDKRVHYYLALSYWLFKPTVNVIEQLNKALTLDPNYGDALNILAYCFGTLGDYEKAIEYLKRYASIFPGDFNPLDSMGEMYFGMGRLDEAIVKYKEAVQLKPDWQATLAIAYIYALKENYSQTKKWIDQRIDTAPTSGQIAEGYVCKAFYFSWLGRLDESLVEFSRAAELFKTVKNESWIVFIDWLKGWIYYDREELELSRKYFKSSFDLPEKYPEIFIGLQSTPFYMVEYNFYLGLMNLKQGRIDSAKSKLAEMKSLLSDLSPSAYTPRLTSHYDLLYAEMLFKENDFEKAIVVCEKSPSLGIPNITYMNNAIARNVPFLKDILANTYYQNGELDKAITEYERLITFDPKSKNRLLVHPKYHYRLAKLYDEKGSKQKAIQQYQKFFDIWKNADEDLPEKIDAQKRLANLVN